jgi:FMN-dependent NADH-azoreductase
MLHLRGSPRARSRSAQVAEALIEAMQARDPLLAVEEMNLWDLTLPSMGGAMIEDRYQLIRGNRVSADNWAAWEEVRTLAAYFTSFDIWVISTPMWNFGVPYRLKHFIDVVTQPGMAFTNDASGNVAGHAAGKRSIIVAAGALDMRSGAGLQHLDFQISYLAEWLRFIGVEKPEIIRVSPTFGADRDVQNAMDTAFAEARAMAAC